MNHMSRMINELLLNIFYANQSDIESAAIRKQILICSIFNLVSITLLFLFGLDAFLKENYLLAFMDGFFLLTSAINYFYLRTTGNFKIASLMVVFVMGTLCLYMLCTGGSYSTGSFWIFIMPSLIFYIFGFKRGRILLLLLIITAVTIVFWPDNPLLQTEYPLHFSFRFLGALLSVSIIAYAYEFTLEDGRNELLILSQKYEKLSRRDELTSLSNRRDIAEKIDNEVSRFERNQHPFCVLMLDLDNFKQINDVHSHHCGDHVLSEVGRTLSQSTQKRDCVARWGGEEFLVLLPETGIQQARIIAERLRENIADMDCSYQDIPIRITLSIGIAEFNQNTTVDDMIKRADKMLYTAKHGGKNMVVADTIFG